MQWSLDSRSFQTLGKLGQSGGGWLERGVGRRQVFPELLSKRWTLHVREGEKAAPPFPPCLLFACRVRGGDKVVSMKALHSPADPQESQGILILSIYASVQTGLSFPRAVVG